MSEEKKPKKKASKKEDKKKEVKEVKEVTAKKVANRRLHYKGKNFLEGQVVDLPSEDLKYLDEKGMLK